MTLVAKDDGITFKPHPEGQFRAVCCDVVDLGNVQTTFKDKVTVKHKTRIIFQTEAKMDDGRPFSISTGKLTVTLNEMGALRPFLESWRGKAFTADELKGFDLENLVGVGAVLQVVHKKEGEKTYSNINAIMKPMKGMEPLAVRDYVRVKDREPAAVGPGAPGGEQPPVGEGPDDDDDLPF